MSESDVILRVNGRDYAGWTSVRVTRGIEQIAGSFELSVTDNWSGQTQNPIKPGDRCRVLIGSTQVIDGYVDDRNVDYSKDNHTITITGRDVTGDLVDCSSAVKQTKGQTLLQIATDACKSFGISVSSATDVDKPFADEFAETGQTVFDLLSTLAGHRGVLLVSDAKGGLHITKEGKAAAPAALVFGQNIEACGARDSMRDRFSDYTAMHQGAQGNDWNGAAATQTKANAADAGARSPRPLIMLADEGGDLDKKAIYERNVRAGRARAITYTVSGWLADGGNLWQPNTRVPVTDPNQAPALNQNAMLITTCTYIRDEQGTRTEIAVMRPGAFDVLATPEASAADSGGF